MTDSLDRLFAAVQKARDRNPSVSRTSKLFRDGVQKMAKKLAEEAIEAEGRVAFRYCDAGGRVGESSNPNGSTNAIAGVFNERFNVLGLMPHPENLIDPLVGGVDGRALFEGLAAA